MYFLQRLGFGVKWRSWILKCLSSAKYSILINCPPKGFILASRGLRQQDPLSPFLFTIVGEPLNRMINSVALDDELHRFSVSSSGTPVSHLQYKDDTLIFCGAGKEEIRTLKATLWCLEAISGLKVNFNSF